jgi:hypothetical protein
MNTPSTKSFLHCPELEIADPWGSLAEEQFIQDILENSCANTDYSDHVPISFDTFGNVAHNYIGHYYPA